MVLINVLSLNVDGIKESPNLDLDVIPFDNPDLYVEFTQEDARGLNTNSLIRMDSYTQYAVYTINTHRTSQNIITNIYGKANLDLEVIDSGSIPIKYKKSATFVHGVQRVLSKIPGQSIGFSKGAVYVKLRVKDKYILLVNLHLPVDTKKANMGFGYRSSMFLKIVKSLEKIVNKNTCVFFGGDLNFRTDRKGVNQLNSLLEAINIRLKELPRPATDKKTFTCKFNSNSNRNCRLTSIEIENPDNFIELSTNVQNRCGDSKRIPSRCDRFLIDSPYSIEVYRYLSLVLLDSSDHNAIYTSFRIM